MQAHARLLVACVILVGWLRGARAEQVSTACVILVGWLRGARAGQVSNNPLCAPLAASANAGGAPLSLLVALRAASDAMSSVMARAGDGGLAAGGAAVPLDDRVALAQFPATARGLRDWWPIIERCYAAAFGCVREAVLVRRLALGGASGALDLRMLRLTSLATVEEGGDAGAGAEGEMGGNLTWRDHDALPQFARPHALPAGFDATLGRPLAGLAGLQEPVRRCAGGTWPLSSRALTRSGGGGQHARLR